MYSKTLNVSQYTTTHTPWEFGYVVESLKEKGSIEGVWVFRAWRPAFEEAVRAIEMVVKATQSGFFRVRNLETGSSVIFGKCESKNGL